MKHTRSIFIGLLVTAIAAGSLSAMDFDYKSYPDTVQKGNILANVGVGFGTPIMGSTVIPPLQASVEYVLPVFGFPTSFGGLVGFTTSSSDTLYSTINYTGIAVAARASWHVSLGIKNLDPYASISLGYYSFTMKDNPKAGYEDLPLFNMDYSQFYYGVNIGARYFFTPKLGASVEIGYSALSYVAAGVTLKF